MIEPQLLKPIEEWALSSYLDNDRYHMSQKLDGHRTIVMTGPLRCYSRTGLAVPVPRSLNESPLVSVPNEWVFDGEMLDGAYHCFDILSTPKGDLAAWTWTDRQAVLNAVADTAEINVVQQISGKEAKTTFFNACKRSGAEGVVFIDSSSRYSKGKRASHALKFKFRKEVDCVVTETGLDGKDNLGLGMYDTHGNMVSVGKVSALTGDGPRAEVGDVVTVTILYVTKSKRLYQPVRPLIRSDKLAQECTIDQLDQYIVNKQLVEGWNV